MVGIGAAPCFQRNVGAPLSIAWSGSRRVARGRLEQVLFLRGHKVVICREFLALKGHEALQFAGKKPRVLHGVGTPVVPRERPLKTAASLGGAGRFGEQSRSCGAPGRLSGRPGGRVTCGYYPQL
jgi:hypothetical protein